MLMSVTGISPRLLAYPGSGTFGMGAWVHGDGRWIERVRRWRWLAGRPRIRPGSPGADGDASVGRAADHWPGSGDHAGHALGRVSWVRPLYGDQADRDARHETHASGSDGVVDDSTVVLSPLMPASWESHAVADDSKVVLPQLTTPPGERGGCG